MGIIADKINEAMRDFVRFTGDGKPGAPVGKPLPVGDSASGEWNPPKKQVRDAFVALAGSADDLGNAAQVAATNAGEAVDSANSADTSATQAQLAALAAGAPLFLTEGEGIAGVADGEMFLVYSDHGIDVYTRNGAAADYEGSLIDRPYKTVTDLIASTESSRGVGTIWEAGGFRYEEAGAGATDYHLLTDGGVKLYRLDLLPITVTVGTGGDFSQIPAALEFLSNQNRGNRAGAIATVNLLAGFVVTEQVLVQDCDLSWVTILSVDPEVTISGVDMTSRTNLGAISRRYCFAAINAGLPTVGVKFLFDETDVTNSVSGIVYDKNSHGIVSSGCGIEGVTENGLMVTGSSSVVAEAATFKYSGNFGLLVEGASRLDAGNLDIRYSAAGARVTEASKAMLAESLLGYTTSATIGVGLLITQGSEVNAQLSNADGCALHGYRGRGAGSVNLRGAQALLCAGASIYAELQFRINASISGSTIPFKASRTGSGAVIVADTGARITLDEAEINGTIDVTGSEVDITGATVIDSSSGGSGAIWAKSGARIIVRGALIQCTVSSKATIFANNAEIIGSSVTVEHPDTNGAAMILQRHASFRGRNATFKGGVGSVSVAVQEGSELQARLGMFGVSGNQAIAFSDSSRGNIAGATMIDVVSAPTNYVAISTASIVQASGTTFTCNVANNTVTSDGLIIR